MRKSMIDYELCLPSDFESYEWEVSEKGWFNEVVVMFQGEKYKLSFYDAARLIQEINDELSDAHFFMEKNLVVVEKVGRVQIEKAVESLFKSEGYKNLVMS